MSLEPLTKQEAQSLDTAAVQRLLGELDQALYDIGRELGETLITYNTWSGKVNVLKFRKEILVERARNLKGLLKGY